VCVLYSTILLTNWATGSSRIASYLAEPIVIEPQIGLLAYEFNEDLTRRLGEKVRLLLEHYDIKPSDKDKWLKLSMHLAHDFVDGMKIIERTSPPKPGPNVRLAERSAAMSIFLSKNQLGMRDDFAVSGKVDHEHTMLHVLLQELGDGTHGKVIQHDETER
jgi:hypothetical protein